ncbi:MAG: GDP-mannose 4,6-dehydratase [Bacteroidia bacterium]|nr:GDP-mannose 4,6-dehydratase [Bacteroidia bacterium]
MSEIKNHQHALVTGGAGFIGSNLVDSLLASGWEVTVLDNFDPFYNPLLKRENISRHLDHPAYTLIEGDIRDTELLDQLGDFDVIVHLAAKAGVRPSIQNPTEYQDVNVKGTQNMLEFARKKQIQQFVFASSSSVYGISPNVPWRESDAVLQPISPYASTKVSGELLGHVYSHLYGIRFIGLRFFTVFGPRQRPDLAIHKFVENMIHQKSIPVYGDGSTRRDYTFVGDIVQGIVKAMHYQDSPYQVFNLANGSPVYLLDMIRHLEEELGIKALIDWLPEQPGDVPQTVADISLASQHLGYSPETSFREGVKKFSEWKNTLSRQPR